MQLHNAHSCPSPDPQRLAEIRKTILTRYDRRLQAKRTAAVLASLCTALTLLIFVIYRKK